VEWPGNVPRLDRPPGPGREDEPSVLPGAAQFGAVGGLDGAAGFQGLGGQIE
jgi:hypothetical protein